MVSRTKPKAITAKIIVAPVPIANNKVRTNVANRFARVLVVCKGAEASLCATMLVNEYSPVARVAAIAAPVRFLNGEGATSVVDMDFASSDMRLTGYS